MVNDTVEALTLEETIAQMMETGEGIEDSVTMAYQERSDGLAPEYDIRTDRFDVALEASDKVSKSIIAKREQRQNEKSGDPSQQTTTE